MFSIITFSFNYQEQLKVAVATHGDSKTQEEILLDVLQPRSGYIRGKGTALRGGYCKGRLQLEHENIIHDQQKKIEEQEQRIKDLQEIQEKTTKQLEETQEKTARQLEKQRDDMQRAMDAMKQELMQQFFKQGGCLVFARFKVISYYFYQPIECHLI